MRYQRLSACPERQSKGVNLRLLCLRAFLGCVALAKQAAVKWC